MPNVSDGDPGGNAPKREKNCPGSICTIMKNFTPIGATVAEICNRTEKKTQQPI